MYAIRLTSRPDGVAVLTIDQPGGRANVLTAELWMELESTIDALRSRTDLRGLVLASAKPDIFIAGADLKRLANATGPNDPLVRDFIQLGLRVLAKLESLPFSTCAAMDGAALGGGLEVALACDSRITGVNPKLQLGLPEVNLGLIPGWGGTQRLPRITGLSAASEIVTSGRSMTIQEATQYQLLDSVIGTQSVVDLVDEAAASIAKPAVASLLRTRRGKKLQSLPAESLIEFVRPTGVNAVAEEAVRVMVEGTVLPLYEGIKIETEAFMWLAGSEESRRLIAEFFASRKK